MIRVIMARTISSTLGPIALAVTSCSIGQGEPHASVREQMAPVPAKAPDVDEPAMDCVSAENASDCWSGGCDHMIMLASRCKAAVDCDVSTDVDPGWIRIHLDPGQSFRVTTHHTAENDRFEIRRSCWYFD